MNCPCTSDIFGQLLNHLDPRFTMVMVAIGGYQTLAVFLRVYEKNACTVVVAPEPVVVVPEPVVVVPALRSRKTRRKSTKRTKRTKR